MEELSIYNLTITEDHRLKVNNTEVGGDGTILPGDSESLLAWALVQVGYAQEDSASNMVLQIEDGRDGGYGTQRVTIPPGRRVLIEALRSRTGRDLSHISEEVRQRHEQSQEAPAPEAGGAPETEADWFATSDEGVPQEAPSAPSEPPAPSPAEQPASAAPEVDAEWADEAPTPSAASSLDEEPVLAPPPSLGDGIPDTPAPRMEPPRPASPPSAHSATERGHEQSFPLGPPTQPMQAVNAWNDTHLPEVPQGGLEQFGQEWPSVEEIHPAPVREQEPQELPPVSPFAEEARAEVNEHEDISTKKVAYKRKRPLLGVGEAKAVKEKKPKKERSKPMIAALIVVSLIAVFFAVQFVRAQGENSYVATCIDERTMVRQASVAGCKNDEASHYRWWYTPSGSEVPAVNQTVSQAEGTRIRPEEAVIHEDYESQGGLYGGDEE